MRNLRTYIAASGRNYLESREYLLQLRDLLISLDIEILHDWILEMEQRMKTNIPLNPNPTKWKKIYKQIIQALRKVDFIIVNNTIPSFSNGYLTAYALHLGKPVLFLQLRSKSGLHLRFVTGIDHPLLTVKFYSHPQQSFEYIKEYVAFLQDTHPKRSFHLRLSDPEFVKLVQLEQKLGMSKTQVIRELLKHGDKLLENRQDN